MEVGPTDAGRMHFENDFAAGRTPFWSLGKGDVARTRLQFGETNQSSRSISDPNTTYGVV
jgi:hypothetical protein